MMEFLWSERFRPKAVADTILPAALKSTFQEFVDKRCVPNLLLSGGPGVGKTTVARAMLEEIGADYIIINGSMNGNIDTLRNDIMQFASTVSFQGGRKYVILDEADYLNANSTQPALRNFMEEFSNNCGFILTCNYKNRIIEPLHSRCSVIDFVIPKQEKVSVGRLFFDRVKNILTQEKITFDKAAVAELVTRHYPDWRRVINELQRYSATGSIDSGILSNTGDASIKELTNHLRAKSFTETRKWVAENSDTDTTSLFRKLYDYSSSYLETRSIPQLVLILADYQYKAAFVSDHEINIVACFTEIMTSCEFKA